MKQWKMAIKCLAFILVITLGAGCGKGSSPATAPVNPVSSPQADASLPATTGEPNPLNVHGILDESLAVSALIPMAGGNLSATSADGTRFTLTFPDGALLHNETITLTPLSGVEGLPFSGGLVGGVQMVPEGLRLFKPATLTIESPKTVAAKGFETVAFGYHQAGEGVYLIPSKVTGNILTLELWHFCGEAAALATPAEIQTQVQQHLPSIAEDALLQQWQEHVGLERNAELLGQAPDPEGFARYGELLRQIYDRSIDPQLAIALADCTKASDILSRALSWARQAELTQEGFQTEILKIYDFQKQVMEKCFQTWTGNGTFRRTTGQSGMAEVTDAYTFQITFRVLPEGTIAGSGILTLTEETESLPGMTCNRPGVSSVIYPPMEVAGTVKPGTASPPEATFQLNFTSYPAVLPSQWVCDINGLSNISDYPATDGGFFLDNIEIAAVDGAQTNGKKNEGSAGVTLETIWELQISKQATP